jgi:hypothetical protein
MTRGITITDTRTLTTETCYSCGVLFAMEEDYRQELLQTKRTFYCPNGHGQNYVGKSNEQRRREAEQARASAEEEARIARIEAAAAKKELRRLKQRANAGACPYCKRSFVQLTRHIHTKHPGQVHA